LTNESQLVVVRRGSLVDEPTELAIVLPLKFVLLGLVGLLVLLSCIPRRADGLWMGCGRVVEGWCCSCSVEGEEGKVVLPVEESPPYRKLQRLPIRSGS